MNPLKYWNPWNDPSATNLTVRGVGIEEQMPPGAVDRPSGTDDYLFMLYYDEVWLGGEQVTGPHPAGSMMIWAPGMRQYYGNRDATYVHSWLHCSGDFVRKAIKGNRLPLVEAFVVADSEMVERHLYDMYRELAANACPDQVIVQNLLENWIRAIARLVHQDRETEIPERFLAVRRFMEASYTRAISLEELAERTHYSIPHFCAEFRRYFGTTAIEMLISLRMQEALHLLGNRNLSVGEVAARVGYEDIYHFSRQFKKRFGTSPSKAR